MQSSVKKPIVTTLSIMLFTFLIFSYQNCAKPLEEIGMNTSLSGSGTCRISAQQSTVLLNVNQAISFSYSPANLKIRIVIMNNASGVFTESVYAQSGVLDVMYTDASQAGTYTAHGVVEATDGSTAGTCTTTYTVQTTSGPTTPPPTTATYSWISAAWSACSASACGTSGTQIRAVTCQRNDGVAMPDTSCSAAGTKPSTSQPCNAPACSSTYVWSISSWGACSVTACGQTGTQSRTVICRDQTGATVADYLCGSKPSTTQSCSTPSCGGGGGGGGGGRCKIGDICL